VCEDDLVQRIILLLELWIFFVIIKSANCPPGWDVSIDFAGHSITYFLFPPFSFFVGSLLESALAAESVP